VLESLLLRRKKGLLESQESYGWKMLKNLNKTSVRGWRKIGIETPGN